MDCGGKAQPRHRFGAREAQSRSRSIRPGESGVALRFPPQSMMLGIGAERTPSQFCQISTVLGMRMGGRTGVSENISPKSVGRDSVEP